MPAFFLKEIRESTQVQTFRVTTTHLSDTLRTCPALSTKKTGAAPLA